MGFVRNQQIRALLRSVEYIHGSIIIILADEHERQVYLFIEVVELTNHICLCVYFDSELKRYTCKLYNIYSAK